MIDICKAVPTNRARLYPGSIFARQRISKMTAPVAIIGMESICPALTRVLRRNRKDLPFRTMVLNNAPPGTVAELLNTCTKPDFGNSRDPMRSLV